jgi:two-component system sensor histidine kinase/response regulator
MSIEGGSSNPAAGIKSKSLSAGLLEMVSDLVWSLSAVDQKILYINPAAERIYGRPINQLMDQSELWITSVHPDDREVLQKNLDQLVDLKFFTQEFRILQPSGRKVWLKGRFRLLRNESGEPAYIAATAKDVSKRVTAERQLEESQAIYLSLVESLPINVFRKDRDGKIVFANKRYCDELQLGLEELLGKTDKDLFPEMADKYLKDDAWVLQTGLPFHDIESHPKGKDDMIYVEVLKAPVTDSSGRRIGIQGMFWDVTERKKAESALREAKEMAESASRAKTDFLANVSHEIRTPMNGIIGITELLISRIRDKEELEYLRLIESSAESLLMLINDILDFSKIEAGKVQLESSRFLLRESLGDTLRSLAVRAHSKGLELIASFDPEVPNAIVGDLVRLRQVVVNLVSNAVKFTHHGQVEFNVKSLGAKGGVARLRFLVRDSGIGIPRDKLGLIFTEFEQADSSTTRKYGGTGLGLAISSRLVRLMGGDLVVESELNQGSTFTFDVDLHFDSSHVEDYSPLSELEGQKILLCIHNKILAENLLQSFQRVGLVIRVAESTREAMNSLQNMSNMNAPFAAIVTDVDLVDDDGLELVARVRADERLKNTPIVLLLSAISTDDQEDRSRLRIDDILIKPAKEKDLLESLALALGLLGPETTAHNGMSETVEQDAVPLRVLLAEDNLVNQKLACAILEKQGHNVTVAGNGRQAVSLYQMHSYDLVLMDVQMPEVDGFQATREIRKLQTRSGQRIPIVALTAHASAADRQKCLAAGMDEYLAKPIRSRELCEVIEKQTGRPSGSSLSSGPSRKDNGPIDWAHAFETVGGDRNLLEDLIKVFLKDQSRMLASIEAAVERNDEKDLRLNAHSIKGALTHLGGRESVAQAEELEMMAQSEDLSEAKTVLERFRDSLSEVTNEMRQFLTRPNS